MKEWSFMCDSVDMAYLASGRFSDAITYINIPLQNQVNSTQPIAEKPCNQQPILNGATRYISFDSALCDTMVVHIPIQGVSGLPNEVFSGFQCLTWSSWLLALWVEV